MAARLRRWRRAEELAKELAKFLYGDSVPNDAELEEIAAAHAATHVFVAIGDNATRAQMMARCWASGLLLASAISRHSMLSWSAAVSEGAAAVP